MVHENFNQNHEMQIRVVKSKPDSILKICGEKELFISSPGSKVKVSYISLPFLPIHVREMEVLIMEVFILSLLLSFSIAANY